MIYAELNVVSSIFDSFENNIFTIDLSLDPSQVAFNLNVQWSSFINNTNGSIFNFNHKNDELGPLQDRIQQENMLSPLNIQISPIMDVQTEQHMIQ